MSPASLKPVKPSTVLVFQPLSRPYVPHECSVNTLNNPENKCFYDCRKFHWRALLWVGNLSVLQEILPTQGWNPGLPYCRWILYQLSHKGNPRNWADHCKNAPNWTLKYGGNTEAAKNQDMELGDGLVTKASSQYHRMGISILSYMQF